MAVVKAVLITAADAKDSAGGAAEMRSEAQQVWICEWKALLRQTNIHGHGRERRHHRCCTARTNGDLHIEGGRHAREQDRGHSEHIA